MSVKDLPNTRPVQTMASAVSRPPIPMYSPTHSTGDYSHIKTPTRESFAGVTGQRPLPSPKSPIRHLSRNPSQHSDTYLARSDSIHSSTMSDSVDVDMEDADDQDGSEDESVAGDGSRLSKKKKSQKFFCTDFAPCQLSFTRSEHLARHIRKHTGERPFQCHCLRRFSRLDNLRQHAQTVHVNEDIPCDSLAATSTRFQRQIRTDRMRPPNNRARASTISSQGSHHRGHSRNWSGSSVGSVSDIATPADEIRRRPPPLAMAQVGGSQDYRAIDKMGSDATPTRGGLTLDTFSANHGGPGPEMYNPNYNNSASGYSTPTSVFSATTNSPMAHSGVQSPIGAMPRGLAWGGERVPGRRLSVPSAHNPFKSGYVPGHQYMSPLASSTASTFSAAGSGYASPASSVFSSEARREPGSEPDIRRRTWHPGTYGGYGSRPATSGLSYYQTPDAPQPVAALQPAATQAIRLPGIDSFDSARAQPIAPPRRPPSAMDMDTKAQSGLAQESRHKSLHNEVVSPRSSWGSINHGLTRLAIARGQPEGPAHAGTNVLSQAPMPRPLTFPNSSPYTHHSPAPTKANVRFSQGSDSEDTTVARKKKRQAWYNGPIPEPQPSLVALRTSPDGSSSSEGVPTPSSNYAAEYHPAIVHSNGYIESRAPCLPADEPRKATDLGRVAYPVARVGAPLSPPQHSSRPHPTSPGHMDRLDALVAVATSENSGPARR